MRICYFGFYGKNSSRNKTFIAALHQAGYEVEEIHSGSRKGLTKYLYLSHKLYKSRNRFDAIVVGFPGQQVAILARLIYHGPIFFNALLSQYDSVVGDRKEISKWHPYAWYLWIVDYVSGHTSTKVILDCDAYAQYYGSTFNIPSDKFVRIFQSADELRLKILDIPENIFEVHYYSTFLPSHGTDIIVRAAALVRDDNIRFIFSGDGPCRSSDEILAKNIGADNIRFISRLNTMDELNRFICSSWVSLGLFSPSSKADRAIATKVFEALYCARPIITAATTGTRELLTDNVDAMLCVPNNPKDLARKLRQLKKDNVLRIRIAKHGHSTYLKHASINVAVKKITAMIGNR